MKSRLPAIAAAGREYHGFIHSGPARIAGKARPPPRGGPAAKLRKKRDKAAIAGKWRIKAVFSPAKML